MSVTEDLDALRAQHADIETAAYVDMASGTVLYTSARTRPPQERLDALCVLAQQFLDGPMGSTNEAMVLKSTEALFLHRSANAQGEALCIVCAPSVDIGEMLGSLRSLTGRLNG